jgi:hypothetical protein
MKEINKSFAELKEKLGITAFEEVAKFYYTLVRKIEDLTKSRDNWRKKYQDLKEESK